MFFGGSRGCAARAAGLICMLPLVLPAQEAPARLEEVVVTGTIIEVPRRQLATAVSVITGEELELRGYNSVADAMRTQPAIGVSNSGGLGKTTTLRIRGEESYRTLLLIDGVKALDPSAPQVAPSFDGLLTTSDLDRVEVLRGPQGFIYGADAGGVVNVLTRTGAGPVGGRVGIEGGQYGTRKLDGSVSGGNDTGDYYLSVTDLETDGFNAQAADTVLMDDDGAENTTLHARFGWNAGENLRLQFVARDIDASTMFDGCFSSTTFSTVHDCATTTEQTTYKLSADYRSGSFTNRFGYSEVDIARDNLAEGISTFAASGTLSRLEYTGSFEPGASTTIVYGADLQDEDIFSSGVPDERSQDGYYIEYQGDFRDRFFVSAGVRYDDNEDFGSATSTRLSGAYLQALGAGSTLKYRASYGTGFRPPSLFEIAYNAGPFAFPPAAGPGLVEETSRGYDLGIEYDTVGGLHVEITYFDQQIEDAIEFDLVGFSGYLQRPGNSKSDGFEVAARVPLGQKLELIANWTDNDARTAVGSPRLRRPGTLANVGVSFTSTDQDFRLFANYRVSRDAIDEVFGIGVVPLDDYDVLDVSLNWRLNKHVEIYGRLENALDETYQELSGFNTAGRSAYGGARLRF